MATTSYISNIKNTMGDFINQIKSISINVTNPTEFTLSTESNNSLRIFYVNDINIKNFLDFINGPKTNITRKGIDEFQALCANSLIIAKEKTISNNSQNTQNPQVSMLFSDVNGKCILLGSSRLSEISEGLINCITKVNKELDGIQTEIQSMATEAVNNYISTGVQNNTIDISAFVKEIMETALENGIVGESIDNILNKFENKITADVDQKVSIIDTWNEKIEQLDQYDLFREDVLDNFGYNGKINLPKNEKFMNRLNTTINNKISNIDTKVRYHISNETGASNSTTHYNSNISINDIKKLLDEAQTYDTKRLPMNIVYVFNYVLNRLFTNNYYNISHQASSDTSEEYKWNNDTSSIANIHWLGGFNNLMYMINKRIQYLEEHLAILEARIKDSALWKYGDSNKDDKVDLNDSIKTLEIIASGNITGERGMIGDANFDGKIDTTDITEISNQIGKQ